MKSSWVNMDLGQETEIWNYSSMCAQLINICNRGKCFLDKRIYNTTQVPPGDNTENEID